MTPLSWQQIGPAGTALLHNTAMCYKVSGTWLFHLHTREKLSDIALMSVGSLQTHKRITLMVIMVIFVYYLVKRLSDIRIAGNVINNVDLVEQIQRYYLQYKTCSKTLYWPVKPGVWLEAQQDSYNGEIWADQGATWRNRLEVNWYLVTVGSHEH